MRSVVGALLAICLALPAYAAAQDPSDAPRAPQPAPPPPSRDGAIPRSEARPRIETRNSEDRGHQPHETRAAETRGDSRESNVRAVAGDGNETEPRRGASRRVVAAAEDGATRRPVARSETTSADDQSRGGGERRGSVRRPPSDRDGGGRILDRAVPRSEVPNRPSGRYDPRIRYGGYYYPRYSFYYDPWGFGSFGLGYFYYAPWTWAPYGSYAYGRPFGYGFDVGSVRLKVKPRDAEVWVDGYYAGTVDDFDGIFQSLKLDSGGYHIEIRKAGYQTLPFDVRVQPDRTITFRGELKPLP